MVGYRFHWHLSWPFGRLLSWYSLRILLPLGSSQFSQSSYCLCSCLFTSVHHFVGVAWCLLLLDLVSLRSSLLSTTERGGGHWRHVQEANAPLYRNRSLWCHPLHSLDISFWRFWCRNCQSKARLTRSKTRLFLQSLMSIWSIFFSSSCQKCASCTLSQDQRLCFTSASFPNVSYPVRYIACFSLKQANFLIIWSLLVDKPTGWFDFVGSSHQCWHLLIVATFYWWYISGIQLQEFRRHNECS